MADLQKTFNGGGPLEKDETKEKIARLKAAGRETAYLGAQAAGKGILATGEFVVKKAIPKLLMGVLYGLAWVLAEAAWPAIKTYGKALVSKSPKIRKYTWGATAAAGMTVFGPQVLKESGAQAATAPFADVGTTLTQAFSGLDFRLPSFDQDFAREYPKPRNFVPSPDMENVPGRYVDLLKGTEGTGRNPFSSASGQYQFIDSTWYGYVRRYAQHYKDPAYHKYSDPKQTTGAEVMELKKNNDAFKDWLFVVLTNENRAALRAGIGRDPSWGETYLAHQQGSAGAAALLRNPGMNVVDAMNTLYRSGRSLNPGDTRRWRDLSEGEKKSATMAEKVVLQNGGTLGMSAAQFSAKWTSRFGSDADYAQSRPFTLPGQTPGPG